jgi:hypothetical protein
MMAASLRPLTCVFLHTTFCISQSSCLSVFSLQSLYFLFALFGPCQGTLPTTLRCVRVYYLLAAVSPSTKKGIISVILKFPLHRRRVLVQLPRTIPALSRSFTSAHALNQPSLTAIHDSWYEYTPITFIGYVLSTMLVSAALCSLLSAIRNLLLLPFV